MRRVIGATVAFCALLLVFAPWYVAVLAYFAALGLLIGASWEIMR